jgi:hypothetical protein
MSISSGGVFGNAAQDGGGLMEKVQLSILSIYNSLAEADSFVVKLPEQLIDPK